MTDPHLRPRRRAHNGLGNYQAVDSILIDEPQEKDHRSAFSKVFSANPSALWNSAQESFASIPSTLYAGETAEELPRSQSFSNFSETYLSSIPFTMPSRDRTAEFQATAKSILSRNTYVPPQSKRETINQSIQFNQIAKKIGRDLSQTCAKMDKLAEMTKRKSVFEDRSEVESLSRIVKEDMASLNKQIASLQAISRGGHSQTQDHSHLVVVGLQSKLANVGKDFQCVLEQRTENMREQKTRRDKFSSHADLIPMGLPSSSSTSNVRSRLLEEEDEVRRRANGSVALDMGFTTQSQMSLHDDSLAYAAARSSTMETIEGSISELGQIFSQLAHLVAEQGESIMRIDSNVEETSLNVDAAHSELVKYFHAISQNRWLMIKVFGVLIVFFIVFVLFLT